MLEELEERTRVKREKLAREAEEKKKAEEEKKRQVRAWLSADEGHVGYLREAYHGEPYATRFLFPESFASETREARIPAKTLRARLPEALHVVVALTRLG